MHHLEGFLEGCLQESRNRAVDRPPEVEEYVALRRATGAVRCVIDLGELTAHAEIPPFIRRCGAFEQMLTAAVDVACWVNDVFSLPRELASGDFHNLITVLQHGDGSHRQAATAEAASRITARVADYLAAESALARTMTGLEVDATTGAGVWRCAETMRDWMVGTYTWSRASSRYTHIEPRPAGQTPSYLEDLLHPALRRPVAGETP